MEAAKLFAEFEFLQEGTPLFKEKALFLYDPIDQYRPEALRFREMAGRISISKKKRLVLCPEGDMHPFYATRAYVQLQSMYGDDQICSYSPFLGIIPVAISDIFPASHNVAARIEYRSSEFETFVESLTLFVRSNDFDEIIVVQLFGTKDKFLDEALKSALLGLARPVVTTISLENKNGQARNA